MQPTFSQRVSRADAPVSAPAGSTAVLLVTDDPNLRQVASRVLDAAGYHVRTASHSGHALLAAREGRVDILVLELSGPDMSGPSLADRIRREHPDVSTLYLANTGMSGGVDHVLVRPFTRDDLIAGIEAAINVRLAAIG
jgi:DNA-binding response OmpR family regulator